MSDDESNAFQGRDWFTVDTDLASVYFLLDQMEALAEADEDAPSYLAADRLAEIFPLVLQAKRRLRMIDARRDEEKP
jgi:hypothetical protein